ncbi:DEAD/DEAH box helicase [Cobetia amphilecti]|uniref:DEAD/DEAH box helicase n=1 Tax=Cobetia amphilecti TaxID=1055104 RepID=UPI00244CAF49|nr:DEAD/DEAH box helicase family protein [Cobetia litoralis]MDH2422048.1 DEAD/DEAH box helicase family protein [Cobetia litoralis]
MKNQSVKVYQSWLSNSFSFKQSSKSVKGLRKPQAAALYSILARLIIAPNSISNVVMPTGTGKTDTMLALLVAAKFERTLIIVPSEALRTQIYQKAISLDKLREIGVINSKILNPEVLIIRSKQAALDLVSIECYNVVVTTPQSLQRLKYEDLCAFSNLFSHLVIDEAHHVAAKTWGTIRCAFLNKPCIQFTATPFREDKKSIEGSTVYNYPLKQAQADGYFKPIQFHPIREYNPELSDYAIAEKAVELLKKDIDLGMDHTLLARTNTQDKANELFNVYSKYKEYSPVVVHSGVKNKDELIAAVINKEHRIIICVNMLGEGFDLPELKIAAIHDQHRSPAVTLQFIGRLTRVDDRLGDAKFVANIANQKTDIQISELYKEDADWGAVISNMSNDKIDCLLENESLRSSFPISSSEPDILSLNITPKVSSEIYKVKQVNWHPSRANRFNKGNEKIYHTKVSKDGNIVLMITRLEDKVEWARSNGISNIKWNLYLGYYDIGNDNLFVHTTASDNNKTSFLSLICSDYKKVNNEPIFRSLSEIELIKFQNVGLSRIRRDLRFTMHVGRDVNGVITEMENGTAKRSNIFTSGFESGEKVTLGCSAKGKVWEMNSSSINGWISWCKKISRKINDSSINMDDILKNVIRTNKIEGKWPAGLFYADWPESIAIENENRITLSLDDKEYSLLDFTFEKPHVRSNEVSVSVRWSSGENKSIILFSLVKKLYQDSYEYFCSKSVSIKIGRSTVKLEKYLNEEPLVFLNVDGSMVEGNYKSYSPSTINVKLPIEHIVAWDWKDTEINKESMTSSVNLKTVQGYTYSSIMDEYDVIFNDDGAGEVADLVCIKENMGAIYIDLYHCKFCPRANGVAKPGGRVADIYEVCGQASRSVKWLNSGVSLVERLIDRRTNSIVKGFERILKGDPLALEILKEKCRHHETIFNFYIVQPAISYKSITQEQLSVLGTCYIYIKSVSGVNLKVISSP